MQASITASAGRTAEGGSGDAAGGGAGSSGSLVDDVNQLTAALLADDRSARSAVSQVGICGQQHNTAHKP